MPRFIARPIMVEAHQYGGNTLNLDGAFNAAIVSFQPGGSASVSYKGVAITIRPGDWLVRGSDGVVTPTNAAAFQTMFQPHADPELALPPVKIDGRKLRYAR